MIKTIKFNNKQYIGDPLNAININEKFADELIILDIGQKIRNDINFEFLKDLFSECLFQSLMAEG